MPIHLDDKGIHVEQLARRVRALQAGAADSSAAEDWDEMLKIIHFPGYTTPVQLQLIHALMEAAEVNAAQGMRLRSALIEGSRAIVNEVESVSV